MSMSNAAYFKELADNADKARFDEVRNTKPYKALMLELDERFKDLAMRGFRHAFIDLPDLNAWKSITKKYGKNTFGDNDFKDTFKNELETRGFKFIFINYLTLKVNW